MRNAKFILTAMIMLATTPVVAQFKSVTGNKNIQREARSLSGFTFVHASGSANVFVSKGDFAVIVEADENLIPIIETEVVDNTLKISYMRGFNIRNATVRIHIAMPDVQGFAATGSGGIQSTSPLTSSDDFEAVVSGSGSIKADIHARDMNLKGTGSGSIALAGAADEVDISLSGSGSYRGLDLKARDVEIRISGSGSAQVNASENLKARISGSGNVSYRGNPNISQSIYGSGRVKPVSR